MPLRILAIDDSDEGLNFYNSSLSRLGHKVEVTPQIGSALELLQKTLRDERHFQLVILRESTSLMAEPILKELRDSFKDISVLLLTTCDNVRDMVSLTKFEVQLALSDITAEELKQKITDIQDLIQEREQRRTFKLAKQEALPYFHHNKMHMIMDNDADKVPLVIEYILNFLEMVGVTKDDCFRIKLGLTEILINAIAHGNLEMSSEEYKGQGKNFDSWDKEIAARRLDPRFKDKRVQIYIDIQADKTVTVFVQDEGKGFNHQKVLGAVENPTDMFDSFGRGLKMSKAMCTSMVFNEKGNEVTLTYVPE